MRKSLVYIRVRTAKAANTKHKVTDAIIKVLLFDGLIKSDITPTGGFAAGPLSNTICAACIWSGEPDG